MRHYWRSVNFQHDTTLRLSQGKGASQVRYKMTRRLDVVLLHRWHANVPKLAALELDHACCHDASLFLAKKLWQSGQSRLCSGTLSIFAFAAAFVRVSSPGGFTAGVVRVAGMTSSIVAPIVIAMRPLLLFCFILALRATYSKHVETETGMLRRASCL